MTEEICKALFVLHQLKAGPLKLNLNDRKALLEAVFEGETRALSFLAGYGAGDDPSEILERLRHLVDHVAAVVPKTQERRGNPGKTTASAADLSIAQTHRDTGREIPDLVREALEHDPPKLTRAQDVDGHAKRIRDLVRLIEKEEAEMADLAALVKDGD